MGNIHRGDVDCVIAGRSFRLRLTLGALAEIESAFGAPGLAALGERLSSGNLGACDLISIIGAAARGGGEEISDSELASLPLDDSLPALIESVASLLQLAFGSEAAPSPTLPQA